MDELRLVRLDRRRLGDFERLLGARPFDGCFCARWSTPAARWIERCAGDRKANLETTRARLLEGAEPGFLVWREPDGAVVGWTASGPKAEFPLLAERAGSRLGGAGKGAWAVACLAVGFAFRGLGYSRRIVELVESEARSYGCRRLEAYPVVPAAEAEAYRGSAGFYESMGFSREKAESRDGVEYLLMSKPLA